MLKRSTLVKIKSNLWGTKFRFIGSNYLPAFIGQIVYKTSLFHLQPRQMTITLEDLSKLEKITNFDNDQKKLQTKRKIKTHEKNSPSPFYLSKIPQRKLG